MTHFPTSLATVLLLLQFVKDTYGLYVATKRELPEIDGSQGGMF